MLFSLFLYRLHQKYYKALPHLKIWKVEFFPSFKITIKGKVVHLHHWTSFALILTISLFIENGLLSTAAFKGFLTGGIIQGLLDPTAPRLFSRNRVGDRVIEKNRG